MRQLNVKLNEMKRWFPITYKSCLEELRHSKSQYSRFSENKIKWCLTWGYFVPKAKTVKEELLQNSEYDKKLTLTYDERLKIEFEQLRISYVMMAGFYTKSDRCIDTIIPEKIKTMVSEYLKITMIKEQLIINDPLVMKSLEKFDNFDQLADVAYYELNEYVDLDNVEPSQKHQNIVELNIDDILDKITKHGKESLTEAELNFLKNQSK